MGSNTVLNRDFGQWDVDGIYADNGCPIHPKCLECPLPMCVYDLDLDQQALQGYFNRAKKFHLVKKAKDAHHLAELANIHIRSAYRIMRLYKKVEGDYARFIGIYGDKDRKVNNAN